MLLANVDPIDVKKAVSEWDAEDTMLIIVSTTSTTRETIMNAKTIRKCLWDSMGKGEQEVKRHMIACSTNLETTSEFGVDISNNMPFGTGLLEGITFALLSELYH